jgi:hypothetical protein
MAKKNNKRRMSDDKDTVYVSFNCPRELWEAAEKEMKKTFRTKTQYVIDALVYYVNRTKYQTEMGNLINDILQSEAGRRELQKALIDVLREMRENKKE